MLPMNEMMVPINDATGASHDTAKRSIPDIMMIGVIIANSMLANGDASGKLPEKYIMYGNINIGADTASIMSSRTSI